MRINRVNSTSANRHELSIRRPFAKLKVNCPVISLAATSTFTNSVRRTGFPTFTLCFPRQ
jgi:hypothetical protein